MNKLPPTQMDLVLVGGGHSHVHVLKMLGMPHYRTWAMSHGVQTTLIARDLHTPYSGMLPGFVAGHYTYDEIHLDLVQLCRFSNTRLIHAAAKEITYNHDNATDSSSGGMVYCDDGRPPIRFDALSIDVGITPSTVGMTAATVDSIIPVKPIANFCRYYQDLQNSLLAKYNPQKNCTIVAPSSQQHNNKHVIAVIGGGAGGVELALSMDHACRRGLATNSQIHVVIVTRGTSLLAQHNRTVQRIFQRILRERRIDVYYQAEVVGVEPIDNKQKKLVLSEHSQQFYNTPILVHDILWCTQASAARWLSEATPFSTTSHGNFIQVHSTYESISHKGVFACGDCAEMVEHLRPKAGVFAVRAGPPLLENLKRYLSNETLRRHVPQRDFLGIISTGDKYGVASKGWWFALEGRFLWTVKDYIDRTWMDKYTKLPNLQEMMSKMAPIHNNNNNNPRKRRKLQQNVAAIKGQEVADNVLFAADPMRCGGCGAKVGTTTVSRVLAAVHKRQIQRAASNNHHLLPPPPIDHDDAAIMPLPQKGGDCRRACP
ncbi:selenophosphate synthetase [Seminavis robusta]|uniref:Selenophosphate synthetase n=1 Tax=Seminavis robusta TaxID=568900 RepID=A0A9N8HLS2_9STRA|nr:selenophosphate synthetase [Seminavis robusta]|eukprot:Sro699_g189470.1 selenophosphate synthetase (543) ;mRNA; f:28474-30167